MPSLEMSGPYSFTKDTIEEVITVKSAGNYALGYTNEANTFIVKYVGRSDTDLNTELKARLSTKYKQFKYSYANSIKQAYEKECKNYHDLGGSDLLDNDIHPAAPKGTDYKCPICS